MKSEREVAQSYLTLSDPMDCSLPGSFVHRIFQARVLEWGAIAFSAKLLSPTYILSLIFPAPQAVSSFFILKSRSFQWIAVRGRQRCGRSRERAETETIGAGRSPGGVCQDRRVEGRSSH